MGDVSKQLKSRMAGSGCFSRQLARSTRIPRPTMPFSAQAGLHHVSVRSGYTSRSLDFVFFTLNAIHQSLLPVLIPTVPVLALNVLHGHAAVELGLLLVAEVAQPVPLTGDLRVEGPHVVVDEARWHLKEILVEELSLKEAGLLALGVEGPVEGDAGRGIFSVSSFLDGTVYLGTCDETRKTKKSYESRRKQPGHVQHRFMPLPRTGCPSGSQSSQPRQHARQ